MRYTPASSQRRGRRRMPSERTRVAASARPVLVWGILAPHALSFFSSRRVRVRAPQTARNRTSARGRARRQPVRCGLFQRVPRGLGGQRRIDGRE